MMNKENVLFYFFLIGRWLLILVILSSIIIIPSSIRWFETYKNSDNYVLEKVLIDSTDIVSDDGGSPMITGYSKELSYKPIYINNPKKFLSTDSRVYHVWHSSKSKYAYLYMSGEQKFPKQDYLNKLLFYGIILLIGITWGSLGFIYFHNNKKK